MSFLRNGLIAIGVFLGVSAVVAVEFFLNFFGPSISPSETLVATLFGAAIALVGTLFGIYAAVEAEERKSGAEELQSVLAIFSKLSEILNELNSQYRHMFDGDERGFVHFGDGQRLRKPALGHRRFVEFDQSEKVTPLRIKEAWLYNAINDAQGSIDTLRFLQDRHEKDFDEFIDGLLSQEDVTVEGKHISGEFVSKKTDIIELQDLKEHLRGLALSSLSEIRKNHAKLIDLLSSKYGRAIDFYFSDDQPGSLFANERIAPKKLESKKTQ